MQHVLLEAAKKDEDLDIEFRDNCIDIYYRGGEILEMGPSSYKLDEFYFYKYKKEKRESKTWVIETARRDGDDEDVKKAKSIREDLKDKRDKLINIINIKDECPKDYFESKAKEYFTKAKQIMDDWFEDDNRHQEREDQQKITKANQSLESDNDLCVIDIEFAVSTNQPYNKAIGKKGNIKPCRFDMIAVDRKGQLYVIELKQNEAANDNRGSGMDIHKQDFEKTIGKDNDKLFNAEMKSILNTKQEFGLLPEDLTINYEAPIFAAVYSGKEDRDAIENEWKTNGIQVLKFNDYKISL